MEERSAKFGNTANRKDWRLLSLMHLADTREQAYADVQFGLGDYAHYFREVAALPIFPDAPVDTLADTLNASGAAVIGTPDDAIELIEELVDQSGGFGTILLQAHEWADTEATNHSYELFARYVLPHFDARTASTAHSEDWVISNRAEQMGAAMNAIGAAIAQHAEESESG